MSELRFDSDALRAKYRAERDKRLRPDGIAQYVELTGEFAQFERGELHRRRAAAASN